MENAPGAAEGRHGGDARSMIRRAHTVAHAVLALMLLAAVGLPLGPRVIMALVSLAALAMPRLGSAIPQLARTELIAITNVVSGFVAFVLLPQVPALAWLLTLAGLATAAIACRPVVERGVVAGTLALEIAKLPIIATGDFSSSLPYLSQVLDSPLDVIAGSIIQSLGLFAAYGVLRIATGVLRRTQQALIESEARYRRLTEALPNAVLVISEGRVAYANESAQSMLGDVAVSIEGHFLDEVVPRDLIPGLKDAIRRVRTSGTNEELAGRPLGDSSNALHITAALSPLDYDGRPAVMVMISDVSERYAAEQARREGEARFRAAFRHTATPFVLLNPDGTVLDLNDAAVRLLDYPHDQAVGQHWDRFVERRDLNTFREFTGAAGVGLLNHLQAEAVLIPRSGPAVRAEVDITVDRSADGDLRNFIVQIHDVTARHDAEQALRLNEERYRSLFERNPVALYRTKPDGEIVDVNRALLDLLGYQSKDQFSTLDAGAIYVDPSERRRVRERMDRDGEIRGYEFQLLKADGSVMWVRDTARRVEQNGETFFEGSLVDVTARRRADNVLRRAAVQGETVAKLGQFALTSVAIDEVFAETVTSIASVLDVPIAGIMLPAADGSFESTAGVGWPEPEDGLGRERLDALVGFAAGATRPIVVTPPDGDAPGPKHSAVGVAIRGADRLLGVVVAMDSGGKAFSGDGLHFLRSVANVLAAAIERHESRSQLEQLVRSKDEFIASISHELRTPLTVVAGMAHELQDQWGDFTDAEIEELIALVVDQSSDMRNLIEDLLVAARADIGKVAVHIVPMDVAASVDAVLSALPERNGALIRSDLRQVSAMADPTRVRQIIRNLVTNAIRYGGNTIWVSSGERDSGVFVRVHDDGPGIPPEKQEQIFEPYESVHEAVGTPGSVGLGLTISRTLARLMGGDLTYQIADGSLFELKLPAAAIPAVDEPDRGDQPSDSPLSWSSILS
jgi:PAS domain S-box-containing protein